MRWAGMLRLLIHAYTVSLLTPRYSAICSTDNQRADMTLMTIEVETEPVECDGACFEFWHGLVGFKLVREDWMRQMANS